MDIEIVLDANLTPAQLTEIALVAEAGGVRTLWHSNFNSTWDAFIALVPVALATSKIRLGVLAVSPYEMHPLKLTNAILSLNEISKGRAIIAIGGGGAVLSATTDQGVKLDHKKLRVVRGVREAVEIVKGACADELKGYDGELFQVTVPYRRDWAKSTPPKVYTCSDGVQMIRMGARVADGMQLGDQTIHRAPEIMANVKAGMDKRTQPADDFRIGNYWAWHIKADREQSLREARRSVAWRTQMIPPAHHGLDLLFDEPELSFIKEHFDNFAKASYTGSSVIEGVPDELVDRVIASLCSAGDYGDIDRELERYRAYEQAGFTDLALKIFDGPMDAVKTVCEHVVPAFA